MVSWNGLLAKKVGLVSGVANEHSIAAGCAQAFQAEPSSCSPVARNHAIRDTFRRQLPAGRRVTADVAFESRCITSTLELDIM